MDEMPDLSHLSEEERKIIEDVLMRQKAEEHKEQAIVQKADQELDDIEKQINERRDQAMKLIGTQDDAICQICQKTKFSDGIGHKCHYCQLRSCLRCGGKTPIKKASAESKNGSNQPIKTVWACSLCQKRQQILAKTGKWTQLASTHPPLQAPNQSMQDRALANSQRMNQNVQGPQAQQQPPQGQQLQNGPQANQMGQKPAQARQQNVQRQPSIEEQRKAGSGPASQRFTGPPQVPRPLQGARLQGMQPTQQAGPRPGQQQRMPPPGMQQKHQTMQNGLSNAPPPMANQIQNQQNFPPNQQTFPQNLPGSQQSQQIFPPNQQGRFPPDQSRGFPQNELGPVNQQSVPVNPPGFSQTQQALPFSQQGLPSNQQGFPPNQQGFPPNQQGLPLNQQDMHSTQQGLLSNQQGFPTNQQGFPTNQAAFLPTRQGLPPNQPGFPPDQQGLPQNQQGFTPNQQDFPQNQQRFVQNFRPKEPERFISQQNGGAMGYNSQQETIVSQGLRMDGSVQQEPYNANDIPSGDRRTPPPHGDCRPLPNGAFLSDGGPPLPMHGTRDQFNGPGEYVCNNAPTVQRRPPMEEIYSSASTAKPPLPFRSEFNNPLTDSVVVQQAARNSTGYVAPTNIDSRTLYSARVDSRHQFGPVLDKDLRGEFPRDRSRDMSLKKAPEPPALLPSDPKLKKELGISQLGQFETGRFPMAPRISRKDEMGHEIVDHRHHKPKPIISNNRHHHEPSSHTNRVRKSRLSKQNRSLSSSDEEIPSTSECPSCDDTDLVSESFSEQDVLLDVIRKKDKSWRDDAVTAKIKKFLSHPVTWQPSADGCMMIGHMVLHRHSAVPKGDLGFKVVGGRRTDTGRLAAFITRVRKGSVADTVGRLKVGDEVLEWNARTLQNLSFEQVYDIISESKHEPQVEIIVSRPRRSLSETLHETQMQPVPSDYRLSTADLVQAIPVSQQPIPIAAPVPVLPSFVQTQIPIDMQMPLMGDYEGAPMLMISSPAVINDPMAMPNQVHYHQGIASARGQIFGKIQLSLYYSPMDAQLVVTVHQAVDLPPRIDGSPRNPYAKVFLLPDRSERSQRRTKALAGTCTPNWQEPVVYNGILHADLMSRILEVTVWDYDKYGTNEFLGEVVVDLTAAPLMNDTQWHMLTDMDDDNPLRARVQQRRISAYMDDKMMQSDAGYSPYAHGLLYMDPDRQEVISADQYTGFVPQDIMPRSRTFHRSSGREEFYDRAINRSGYHSDDHGYSHSGITHSRRRPRSAAGIRGPAPGYLRPLSPTEGLDPLTLDRNGANRALPMAPGYGYQQQANRQRSGMRYQSRNPRRQQAPRVLPFDPSSPSADPRAGGYASDDNSETSISVTSTQSERPPTHMIRIGQLPPQHSLDARAEDMQMYEEAMDAGTMSDSAVSRPPTGNLNKAAAVMGLDGKRKKSMITRLMPGRAGSANNVNDQKRLGFTRSEEVGVPSTLSPQNSLDLVKQASRESTDSSESWLPIISDGPLGDFVSDLGPGQVVGRQVLASPCLGEIQIGISAKRNSLEVEIIRARNLVAKPGAKINPAKAKTAATRRTTEPLFQARLEFSEPHQGRMLQITVWGDYGRMERKGFMGIAQIQLDKLNLSQPVIGWFKLFHSNSLVAAGSSPHRKDSNPDVNTSPRSN